MSLGTNISRLRARQGLSQDGLAEQLGVSRQSVSKWETDASVPELDKLVKLAALFGITLDELVTGTPPPAPEPVVVTPEPVVVTQTVHTGLPGRQIAGIVLLSLGGLLLVLLTVLGSLLTGLLLASPFLLCGTILLLVPRRAGLWCGWALLLVVEVFLYYATGTRWTMVLAALRAPELLHHMRAQFWIGFVLVTWRVVMVLATLHAWRHWRLPRGGKPLLVTGVGAALWVGTRLLYRALLPMVIGDDPALIIKGYWFRIADQLLDYAWLAGFAWLLARGLAHLKKE